VGLLDFFKRRHRGRGEVKPRLGQFMTQPEVEAWWQLLKESPQGFLVAPKVPLVLLLEEVGGMGEELLSEVVPYVLVAPSGQPVLAYVREEQKALWLTLRGLGLEVKSLEGSRPLDLAAAPHTLPSSPEEVRSEVLPPVSPGSPPPPTGPIDQEEAEASPYSELAKAWWSGQFDVTRLFPPPPPSPSGSLPQPGGRGEEDDPSPRQVSERSQDGESTPACPLCGSPMVLRTAKQGKRAGQQFWSCSRFPGCRGTRPYRAESSKRA
jgi:hypothetical protein